MPVGEKAKKKRCRMPPPGGKKEELIALGGGRVRKDGEMLDERFWTRGREPEMTIATKKKF